MAFTVKSFDQILADMVAWIIANSSNITDMTAGSVVRSFCEGSALSMEEIYVSVYLGFQRSLDNVQEMAFDFDRKAGTKASVDVVFSRAAANGLITIPAGMRVKTPSGLRFILSMASSIGAGDTDSDPSEVEAEEVGTAYNVLASTVTELEDQVAGVETVTNALPAVGGVDVETDIAYKNRFQAYIEGLGRSNIAGLAAGALSLEGITSASIVEIFPPTGNNVEIYVDDGSSGGVSDAKVAEVQSVINGDGTEDNPGYRAAGIQVEVKKPGIVTQAVTATISVLAGVNTDQIQIDIVAALTLYVNTLGVGEDIIYHELVSSIMGVYGVIDVSMTLPTGNITIASTQVGRLGTVSLAGV